MTQQTIDPAVTLWPDCSGRHGAPMGRHSDSLGNAAGCEVQLFRVPMVDSCYDPGGAYWGSGDSTVGYMFAWYAAESDSRGYFRAADMAAAIAHIAGQAPGSTIAAGADLDAMAAGYFEALLFTDNAPQVYRDEWPAEEGEESELEGSIPDGLDSSDIAEDCRAEALTDCAAFMAEAAPLIAEALTRGYTLEQCGRDFWFTRNGHGVGFTDRRELSATGETDSEYERLTSAMVAAKDNPAAWGAALAEREALPPSLGERLESIARKAGSVDSYWDGERVRF